MVKGSQNENIYDVNMKQKYYIYVFIFSIIFVSIQVKGKINLISAIGFFGFYSSMVVIIYFAIKGLKQRLNKYAKLQEFFNKLKFTGKEIAIHFGILILSIILVTLLDKPNLAITKKGRIEPSVIQNIEEKLGMTDIIKITQFEGQYVIKLSDGSVKVIEFD